MTGKNRVLKEKVRYCSCGLSEKVISVSDLLASLKEKQKEAEKEMDREGFETWDYVEIRGKRDVFAKIIKEMEG